mmetsp:Transcript_19321/g.53730  ORF Transcript_19321/g.53730 Transcript_19321/m.53730 type:complete len:306 (-) Transcript_19321:53-970(-)
MLWTARFQQVDEVATTPRSHQNLITFVDATVVSDEQHGIAEHALVRRTKQAHQYHVIERQLVLLRDDGRRHDPEAELGELPIRIGGRQTDRAVMIGQFQRLLSISIKRHPAVFFVVRKEVRRRERDVVLEGGLGGDRDIHCHIDLSIAHREQELLVCLVPDPLHPRIRHVRKDPGGDGQAKSFTKRGLVRHHAASELLGHLDGVQFAAFRRPWALLFGISVRQGVQHPRATVDGVHPFGETRGSDVRAVQLQIIPHRRNRIGVHAVEISDMPNRFGKAAGRRLRDPHLGRRHEALQDGVHVGGPF